MCRRLSSHAPSTSCFATQCAVSLSTGRAAQRRRKLVSEHPTRFRNKLRWTRGGYILSWNLVLLPNDDDHHHIFLLLIISIIFFIFSSVTIFNDDDDVFKNNFALNTVSLFLLFNTRENKHQVIFSPPFRVSSRTRMISFPIYPPSSSSPTTLSRSNGQL